MDISKIITVCTAAAKSDNPTVQEAVQHLVMLMTLTDSAAITATEKEITSERWTRENQIRQREHTFRERELHDIECALRSIVGITLGELLQKAQERHQKMAYCLPYDQNTDFRFGYFGK